VSRDHYPAEHDAERASWAPAVARGEVECRRGTACRSDQLLISPDEPWDLGHPDAACSVPTAPEHRGCNRATMTHYKAACTRPKELHPALRDL
jgi:hypothetical protein